MSVLKGAAARRVLEQLQSRQRQARPRGSADPANSAETSRRADTSDPSGEPVPDRSSAC